MEFQPITMPGADGNPITRDVAAIPTTTCLAVQRSQLTSGSYCYEALHIPTSGTMTRYAFIDADDCRDALVDYWGRLTTEQRQRLAAADELVMQTDRELMYPFRLAFVEKADLELEAAPA